MPECRLYAWGANSHGQLGLGYQSEQCASPQEVDLTGVDLLPEDIKTIVGGAGHTLILDKRGRVFSCGWNSRGQTGQPGSPGIVTNLTQILSLRDKRVREVVCGWDSSMALDEHGSVFVWGSNRYGQLGKSEESLSEPDKIPQLERIKGMAMGLRHSALLTRGGELLVTGSGSKCQLGVLDTDRNTPRRLNVFTRIPDLKEVSAVACGQSHTVALKTTGELYSWGDNKHGQLGIPTERLKIESPCGLAMGEIGQVREIHVGWTHTCCLTVDGEVYAWGRNTYGQLGCRKEEGGSDWSSRLVPTAEKIKQLSVGSEHNVALTENKAVISWGWNEHGNCGNGSTRNVLTPETIGTSKATLVGCGAGHTFAVFTNESVDDRLI